MSEKKGWHNEDVLNFESRGSFDVLGLWQIFFPHGDNLLFCLEHMLHPFENEHFCFLKIKIKFSTRDPCQADRYL